MSIYETKHHLFKLFVLEHKKDEMITDEDIRKTCDSYLSRQDYTWKNVFAENGELVGFILIAKKEAAQPYADYYVSGAYILPEYQGKHLLTTVFKEYEEDHQGTWGVMTPICDAKILSFWDKTMTDIGYRKIDFPQIKHQSKIPQRLYRK